MTDIDGSSFPSGANAGFIAELYARFLGDPAAVDESWRRFFAELGEDEEAAPAELRPPAWETSEPSGNGGTAPIVAPAAFDEALVRQATSASIRALQLIRAYRVRGHLEAELDPLGLDKRGPYPELDYRSYGFDEADLDRKAACRTLVLYGAAGTMARLFDIPAEWRKRCSDVRAASLPGGHFFVDQFPQETAGALIKFLSAE